MLIISCRKKCKSFCIYVLFSGHWPQCGYVGSNWGIVRDGRLTLKMHSTDFANNNNNRSISHQSVLYLQLLSPNVLRRLQPKTGRSALSTKREIHAWRSLQGVIRSNHLQYASMNDVHMVPYHTTTDQTDRRQIKVLDVASHYNWTNLSDVNLILVHVKFGSFYIGNMTNLRKIQQLNYEYLAVCGKTKTNLGLAAGPDLTDPAGGWREPDLQPQTAGETTENRAFSFCVHAGSRSPSSTSSTAWCGSARC